MKPLALALTLLLTSAASAQAPTPEVYQNLSRAALQIIDRSNVSGAEVEIVFNVRLMLQAIATGKLEVKPIATPLPKQE